MSELLVPVSYGELIDKISILEIKSERMQDAAKLANVNREREALLATWSAHPASRAQSIEDLWAGLKRVNGELWDIEDQLRRLEAVKDFGPRFVELARAVYFTNDDRSAAKAEIDRLCGSELTEIKEYCDYRDEPRNPA